MLSLCTSVCCELRKTSSTNFPFLFACSSFELHCFSLPLICCKKISIFCALQDLAGCHHWKSQRPVPKLLGERERVDVLRWLEIFFLYWKNFHSIIMANFGGWLILHAWWCGGIGASNCEAFFLPEYYLECFYVKVHFVTQLSGALLESNGKKRISHNGFNPSGNDNGGPENIFRKWFGLWTNPDW